MKICIVGSGGYIGTSLANYYSSKGTFIKKVTSKKSTIQHNIAYFGYSELNDPETCMSILDDIDVLFYLCSPNQQEIENNPSSGLEVVLGPLSKILEAKKSLERLKVIYFSTAQVFNLIDPDLIISDLTYPKPNNYYGLYHYFGEKLIAQARSDLSDEKLVSIRLTNTFGFLCDNTCNWRLPAVNEFISEAFENNEIMLKSDGTPFRDFLDMKDLLSACDKISKIDSLPENLIFGSGLAVNLSYVACLVQKLVMENLGRNIGVRSEYELHPAEIRTNARYEVDEKYIRTYSPSDLESRIAETIIDYARFRT